MTIELTESERAAVNAAACGNCGERTAVLNLVARIKADAVAEWAREALTGALHPEFGTERREPDGVIYKAVQEAVQAERERIAREFENQLAEAPNPSPDYGFYTRHFARIARGEGR